MLWTAIIFIIGFFFGMLTFALLQMARDSSGEDVMAPARKELRREARAA